MDKSVQVFDIYKFINSEDVAGHCRNINYLFGTIEMAKLIYMSRLPDEEKMQGYKWLIENAPDEPIPDIKMHIPYFALGSGHYTSEEVQRHTKVYKGCESVLSYLSECIASGSFIDIEYGYNYLKNTNIHIPHPFKVGDLLEHIITSETYLVERVDDIRKITGKKNCSQFCLELKRQRSQIKPDYVIMMEVSDLHYCPSRLGLNAD